MSSNPCHSSASVVTNEDGIMVELLDYNPYGSIRSSWSSESADGEAESNKTYIGEYSDDETGLSYLNARYYDPARGQFLSQDPLFYEMPSKWLMDPQAQNAYAYARNNPVKYVDPEGEFGIPFITLAITNYKPIARAGLSAAAHVGSQALDTPMANAMFQHSLQDNPGTFTNENYPDAADAIRSTDAYESLSASAQAAVSLGQLSGNLKTPVLNETADLFYSINGTTGASFTAIESGSNYNISTTISDRYDFKYEDQTTGFTGNDFGQFINNTAALAQKVGIIQSYNVSFSIEDNLK